MQAAAAGGHVPDTQAQNGRSLCSTSVQWDLLFDSTLNPPPARVGFFFFASVCVDSPQVERWPLSQLALSSFFFFCKSFLAAYLFIFFRTSCIPPLQHSNIITPHPSPPSPCLPLIELCVYLHLHSNQEAICILPRRAGQLPQLYSRGLNEEHRPILRAVNTK